MKTLILTEIVNCAKIGAVMINSFYKWHEEYQLHIVGTKQDFSELGELAKHPNNILIDISDNDEVLKKYKRGHAGTAHIFAMAISGQFGKFDAFIHIDSDIYFKRPSLFLIENAFNAGFDIVGSLRCYGKNPSNVKGLDKFPDSISTYFMGIKLNKIPEYPFKQLAEYCEGAGHPLGWPVLDFFDGVTHGAINNGAKVLYLNCNIVGGQNGDGKKVSNYKTNMHMDCGSHMLHMGGVGSGYAVFTGKSKPQESYANWSLGRYSFFAKAFYDENIGYTQQTEYTHDGRWCSGNYDDNIFNQFLIDVNIANDKDVYKNPNKKKMSKSISIYGSHDASVCVMADDGTYRIYELERLFKERNYHLSRKEDFSAALVRVREIIKKDLGFSEYSVCYYADLKKEQLPIVKSIFGIIHFERMSHHYSHAAGALYQSPFKKCLIISSDGGGTETDDTVDSFCIFTAFKGEPPHDVLKKIVNLPVDLCNPYMFLAIPCEEIYKTDPLTKSLTYAGKMMGLAAYGNVREEWIPHFEEYYYKRNHFEDLQSLSDLGKAIDLPLGEMNSICNQTACDVAATSQHIFEKLTLKFILPFIEMYKLPVVLTGGAALNVLMNQKLRDTIPYPVFVPVNPNDCGLSFGMMVWKHPPTRQENIAYSGFGILDRKKLSEYIKEYSARQVDQVELAEMIASGKIIGIVVDNSECGARALGHRSILCNPVDPGMKDKLNKIKNREYFRPFAPVCREEDQAEYFETKSGNEFMSFAPKVKEEYRKKIPSVVHVDGTARLQTVNPEQNYFLYNLICKVKEITGIGVLLNTSFNIKGAPILTTIEDALYVLNNTDLDAVYIEGYLFQKK